MTTGDYIKVALIAVTGAASTATVTGVMFLLDRLGLIQTHDLFYTLLRIGSAMTVVSLAYAAIYYRRRKRTASKKP